MAKRFFIASGLVLLFFLLCGGASGEDPGPVGDSTPIGQEFAADQLLVRFRPSVAKQRAAEILSERGAARIRRVSALGVDVLHLPPGLSVERAVEVFSHLPEVEFAEPNYILWAVAPSQTEIVDQWGLTKIQAPDAWPIISDMSPVLLAIVDTGIDRDHTDLLQNIWQNLGEINGSPGIDDDGNGYVDDTWGWDFQNNDNDPFDDNMHGTLVSSVAAAVQDGSGVAGVCPWCTLLAVKVLGADGSGYIDTVASGITYAADNGARVISLSLGGASRAQTLENAVNYAWNKGALVVAAAGNDGADARLWPAAYANAMAVASTNKEDYRSCFSNYGGGYISVAAPGEAILGAVPNQGHGTYSGTSLSTPHVSGLGGLLFSQVPDRTNVAVRNIIETTVNDLGPLGTDAYFGSGRINAYRAVVNDTTPTDPPAGLFSDDLTASGYAHARKLARDAEGTLHLVWHGRDGGQYRVLYATSSNGGVSWSPPQVVFGSSSETFHPALAVDGANVYIAFPTKHNASHYRIFFTSKPLASDTWSPPVALMGGSYHAVRPDLYYDPSGGKLHLVASSFDDAPYVHYTSSENGGATWSPVRQVNVDSTSGQKTRYADVHANGPNVYIAGRTVEFTFFGLIPRYRVVTIRSLDNGDSWANLTELAVHDGLFSGEYGASLAGAGDRLYLAYEHAGAIYVCSSDGGTNWSGAENIGSGAWPSITQATDGQAWLMWESGGNLSLRHYTGTAWDPAETVGEGNYPNLKLGTTGGSVEWAATHCSGAPYRLTYASCAIAANNPPVANAGGPYLGTEDVAILFDGSSSSDPDGDPLSYSWDFGDGTNETGISPSHAYAYGGTFTVTLTVTDGRGGMDAESTTATVEEVNDPPVADPNGPYSGTVGDPIGFEGSASFDPDNQDGTTANDQTLTYAWDFGDETTGTGVSPSHTYNAAGEYTVTLIVSDGVIESAPAMTAASVTEANNPPVANDDSDSTQEDTAVTIDVLANDTDVDWDTLTVTNLTQPSNGTATLNGDQTVTYSPSADFNGTDSFTYAANDGKVDSNVATVTVTVEPLNDAPVANDDSETTLEDTAVTIDVLANDTDVEGDTLTVSNLSDPAHGTVTPNDHKTVTYTPDSGYTGEDSFTYTVNDGTVDSDPATVTITVNPAAPTAYVNIDMSKRSIWKWWRATATVTITENAAGGPPIAGAAVEAHWSGVYEGSVSGTTDKDGKVSFRTRWITKGGDVCFSVDRVVKDGHGYDLDGNWTECISGGSSGSRSSGE